jgi:uncharacterized membrane protein
MLLVFLAAAGIDLGIPGSGGMAVADDVPSRGGSMAAPATETARGAVVRAVMFWANGCPHCHEVLDRVLPPLKEHYGDRLDVRLIEIRTVADVDRFLQVAAAFGFQKGEVGVPFMIIGDRALVGSTQIPAELPALVEKHLAAGGVAFARVPGLEHSWVTDAPADAPVAPVAPPARVTPQAQSSGTSEPARSGAGASAPAESPGSPRPSGFGLAVAILAGMVVAAAYGLVGAVRVFTVTGSAPTPARLGPVIPVLAVVGLGVAGYLAYVETLGVPAFCGPVGDCNTVQSSTYARLFGVLPVAVLGAAGYLCILAAWLWARFRSDRLATYAPLVILGATLLGVLFSLYLTYLEPFVIGAVCAWCLTSAVIMTLLMLTSLGPGLRVLTADKSEVGLGGHAKRA